MAEQLANRAVSTLNGGISDVDITAVLTDASSFPTAGNFRIRIDDEIMLVTSVAGSTFTIVRAQEDTPAVSHANGATVDHIVTAGALQTILAERQAFGAYADRPVAGVEGRLYFCEDNSYIYRDNGITWDAWGPNMHFTIPPQTGWTAINGASGISYAPYYGLADSPGANTMDVKALVRAVTAPYTLIAAYLPQLYFDAGSDGVRCGVCWRESATGEMHLIGCRAWFTSAPWLSFEYLDAPTGTATNISGSTPARYTPLFRGVVWVKLEDDETDRKVSMSYNGGHSWYEVLSMGRTTDLTPDQVGFYIDTRDESPAGTIILLSWFEA